MVKRLRHRPFTAVTRVRFPLESFLYADVAQLAEQLICNQQVIGSSPIIGFEMIYHLMDGFPSGQRGQTVNLLAMPSKVRILLRPFVSMRHNFILYRGVEQSGSSPGS